MCFDLSENNKDESNASIVRNSQDATSLSLSDGEIF